jgi:SAM-dependent methyltransferase
MALYGSARQSHIGRMSELPKLFDHAVLRLRAPRAHFGAGADFLVKHASHDLAERLGTILRPFAQMLDVGTPSSAFGEALARLRPGSELAHVTPAPGEAGDLRLGAAKHDLIVSGLALQHVNDLPGSLVQIARALKPDGLFMGCLVGGASLTELRQCLTEAESEVTGGVSPRVFPFADVRDMGGLLQRAGLALPVADSEVLTVRYGDMFGLMADLRAMGGTNILNARSKRFTPRRVMLKAAEIYASRFADADGRIRATFELVWVSGWAPHDSQQKPLKPGSAKQRLADALRVPEHPAGEKP